jgi:hypothetical protein
VIDAYGSVVEQGLAAETRRRLEVKPAPMPLCPPGISHYSPGTEPEVAQREASAYHLKRFLFKYLVITIKETDLHDLNAR